MRFQAVRGRLRRGIFLSAVCSSALFLAACGGGDDSSGNGGGGVASPPTFTSPDKTSVAENTTGAVYTARATDAQGSSVAFTITGGTDASAFKLDGAALSFVNPPNYDLPGDANGDNVYEVTLQASNGKANSSLSLLVTVTNDREGIKVTRVATGLVDPVGISSLDSGSSLLIALKANAVVKIDGSSGTITPYYSVTNSVGNPVPGLTLLGMTRAQSFGASKGLYLLTQQGNVASIACAGCWSFFISETLADVSDGTALAIGTGLGGTAYVAIGDAGGTRAQDISGGFGYGKVFQYLVNPDPYAGASVSYFDAKLVGIGVRAPSAIMQFPNSRVGISDRGETTFDELSLTEALLGNNFGWPYFEGTHERSAGGAALTGLVKPSLVIPLGSEKRQSRGIVGGVAYTGDLPGIRNHYVFADKDGRIWSIPLAKFTAGAALKADDLEVRDEDFAPDVGKIDHPVGMAIDAFGVLYILDSDGELFRVESSTVGSIVLAPLPT